MRRSPALLLAVLLLLSACAPAEPTLRAGLRASHYGIQPFPDPDWWVDSATSMASRFPGAAPTVIWIVGVVNDEDCWLNFPAPEGATPAAYPRIIFSPTDDNAAYLDRFDEAGVRVWLQVEPGSADVGQLIDLMLDRYGDHPSVIGVGVDVEWYRQTECRNGCAVGDAEAAAWVERVRAHDRRYCLFLKHWLPERLPPTEREGLLFLDDSQQFVSLEAMVEEFQAWGEHFAPAPVGFQFGYPADHGWWDAFDDPPSTIGQALIEAVPNLTDLCWVDFTADQLWPQE